MNFSTMFAAAVLLALLGTAGLDAYAFSTFFGSSGGGGHGTSVVHLDRSTTQETASVKGHRSH